MVKDRLADLHAQRGSSAGEEEPDASATAGANDPLLSKEHWSSIDSFLEKCTRINDNLGELEGYLSAIKDRHRKIMSLPDSEKDVTPELNGFYQKFSILSKSVREEVQDLAKEAEAAPLLSVPSSQTSVHSVDNRIKKNQVSTITTRLMNVLKKYNEEQLTYKERRVDAIKNYLKLQDHELSDEEVMQAIDKGEVDKLTTGLLLALSDKKALFNEVKTRKDEIQRIENSIRELHELFHDMHVLVMSQGEMVDSIEMNIQSTVDYAMKASENVKGARELQKKARKMKICICIGLTILAIILIFFIQAAVCLYTPLC